MPRVVDSTNTRPQSIVAQQAPRQALPKGRLTRPVSFTVSLDEILFNIASVSKSAMNSAIGCLNRTGKQGRVWVRECGDKWEVISGGDHLVAAIFGGRSEVVVTIEEPVDETLWLQQLRLFLLRKNLIESMGGRL